MIDLLKSRRSIRRYKDVQIEKEKIEKIIQSALLAPSSRGRRPWQFIAVTEKELLKKLSQCRQGSSQFLSGASLGIVIAADPELCDVWIEDCSIAATLIQLTAHSLELGSCWIQVRDRFHSEDKKAEDYIKEALDIPKKYTVECIIAIGYPDEDKKPYDEDNLLYEKVHYNSW
jgi:nitroreductase